MIYYMISITCDLHQVRAQKNIFLYSLAFAFSISDVSRTLETLRDEK